MAPRYHTNQFWLTRCLLDRGHEVDFHVVETGPTEDHEHLQPRVFSPGPLSWLLSAILRKTRYAGHLISPALLDYAKVIKKLQPGLFIIRDPHRLFSFTAALCARLMRVKIVFYSQKPFYRRQNKIENLFFDFMLSFFNASWFTPVKGEQQPDLLYHLKHRYFIPMAVCPADKSPVCKPGSAPMNFMMVGKFHQTRKNHRLFVDAIACLAEKWPVRATIIGECVSAAQQTAFVDLADYISSCGLTQIISLKQNVRFSEMNAEYDRHDVFVLPASSEPCAVSPLEAMARGLPAVCSSTCGSRHYIVEGRTGFIFSSDDLKSLVGCLERFYDQPDLLETMPAQCIAEARAGFSAVAFYAGFCKMLNERWKIQLPDSDKKNFDSAAASPQD